MNKKGTLGLAILTSIMILIVGLMMVNFITPEIDTARASLACASPSTISDGVKLFCLITDATVPYWIVLVLSLVVGTVTARFVF